MTLTGRGGFRGRGEISQEKTKSYIIRGTNVLTKYHKENP
jgi:hypothetical protein